MRGKLFAASFGSDFSTLKRLRILGSSGISEALYSLIAIVMMELAFIPLKSIFQMVAISFSIKALYSIVLAGPSNLPVHYLKNLTGMDAYDFSEQFTPFKYVKNKRVVVYD